MILVQVFVLNVYLQVVFGVNTTTVLHNVHGNKLQASFASFNLYNNSMYKSDTLILHEERGTSKFTKSILQCAYLCMKNHKCYGFFIKENLFCALVDQPLRFSIESSIGTKYYEKSVRSYRLVIVTLLWNCYHLIS